MMLSISKHFAQQIYEVHFGSPWYGLSFRDSIPTIDPSIVFKLTKENLNTIAQTLAHATQWRKSVSNILLSQPTELSVAHPLNWQSNDQLREIGWAKLITQSNEAAHHLIELLKQFDDQYLNKTYTLKFWKHLFF